MLSYQRRQQFDRTVYLTHLLIRHRFKKLILLSLCAWLINAFLPAKAAIRQDSLPRASFDSAPLQQAHTLITLRMVDQCFLNSGCAISGGLSAESPE